MPDRARVPRWSSLARSGSPAKGAIWPFDPELLQLEAGLRRVIKRETRSAEEARVAVEWFRSRGLDFIECGPVILAARDRPELDRARDLDAAGDRDSAAVRELGGLLGYPSCCVEAYLRLELRDDASLFDALLPRTGGPFAPESAWLLGPLALVSHAPCALDCEPTLALGAATLSLVEAACPGFRARWRHLARRLHLIDADGRAFSCATELDALELVCEPFPRVVPCSAPAAARVRFRADHRG